MAAVEILRRELVSYGVGVSNLAKGVRKRRVEIDHVAEYIRDLLNKHLEVTETGQPSDTEAAQGVTNSRQPSGQAG